MKTKQQDETLTYFKKQAGKWAREAKIKSPKFVNVIKQRNDYVLGVVVKRGKVKNALDVGCGTGDLVCQISKKAKSVMGIDFAEDMITIARNNARRHKCKNTEFICSSIFDHDLGVNTFDLISANGFLEYISLKELNMALDMFWKALKKGGSLVVGSRNRLLNIFSLNKFTQDELSYGNIDKLIYEAVKISNLKRIADLRNLDVAPLQKDNARHAYTGIKVSTRYQYTPAQLIDILVRKGFAPVEIYPIHIHGAGVEFKKKHPEIHANIANLLQSYANREASLIPFASSFMLHAKKKG
jgi:ubiquinone/menaquinone biosynthesis C-methylase UbiE